MLIHTHTYRNKNISTAIKSWPTHCAYSKKLFAVLTLTASRYFSDGVMVDCNFLKGAGIPPSGCLGEEMCMQQQNQLCQLPTIVPQ